MEFNILPAFGIRSRRNHCPGKVPLRSNNVGTVRECVIKDRWRERAVAINKEKCFVAAVVDFREIERPPNEPPYRSSARIPA